MDWVRGEILGHGNFATVSLAVPTSQSPLLPPLMAVKSCGALHSSSLLNEKLILEQLKDCPQIVRCFGDSFSYKNGEKLYNVLLEYASGGSLADKVKNSEDRRMPESEVRRYTKSLLKGLHYIHKFGYVHCDIKLQNILLGPNGGVKIADFGLGKRDGREGPVRGSELRGTPMYMSPEMVGDGEQGAPADIWALGCVVSEMVGGSPAWNCSDLADLIMRIGVGEGVPEIPGILSEEGKDFLGKCFVKNPSKRWTAEMLLSHPFVRDHDFDDDDDADSVAALKDRRENSTIASISPRCPFDFPDLVSGSITSLPSPEYRPESELWLSQESNWEDGSWSISAADRLRRLVSEQAPNWSVSDGWVTIR